MMLGVSLTFILVHLMSNLIPVPSGSDGWDPGEKSGREPSALEFMHTDMHQMASWRPLDR